jgi:branched-chain amino acid transport system substrate-binding protein
VIALSSAYGDGFVKAIEGSAAAKGVKIVGVERYNVTDQSVIAQVARLMLLGPDAIYIASGGTAGALPQIELSDRGYAGRVYQTGGAANSDFLRVAGKSAEGMYITALPLLVAEQLKENDPLRTSAEAFTRHYEGKHGAGTRSAFSASAYDIYWLLENAAKIALRNAQPGTEAFRVAMRDGMEQTQDLTTTTCTSRFQKSTTAGWISAARFWSWSRVASGSWRTEE